MSSSQVSKELFGHTEPLAGYLFKPFRAKDVGRWFRGEVPEWAEYGRYHSCYPYYAMFLGPTHAKRLRESLVGSHMTSGQAKRVNRECGFTRGHKQNLWYCPVCVTEDFARRGETCWRRLPQMNGAVCCPVHGVKLRESGVRVRDINYQIIPATYGLIHYPEPKAVEGNVYSERYMILAKDIAWLLENGYSMVDNEWVRETFIRSSGRAVRDYLFYKVSAEQIRENRFEDYLAGRIIRDCGKDRVPESTRVQMGTILSIEGSFGSMSSFCPE